MSAPSEAAPLQPARSRVRKGAALLLALLALICAGLAAMRAAGAIAAYPGSAAAEALADGRSLAQARLADAIAALERAARIDPFAAQYAFDLSLLKLSASADPGLAPAEAERLIRSATADLHRGLAMRPADSGAWARLALARLRTGAEFADTTAALKLSLQTSPQDRRLMLFRTDFALSLWPLLDEELRDAIREQLRGLWTWFANTPFYPEEWLALQQIVCGRQAVAILEDALARELDEARALAERRENLFSPRACAATLARL